MNASVAGGPLRVLLVEDSLPVGERVQELIEATGQAIVVGLARTSTQARNLFNTHAPDAVVLDLQLRDGLGYPLLEEFKRSQPACTLVVLTHSATREHRLRCAALGADHFLEKSSEFDRLANLISALPRVRARAGTDAPRISKAISDAMAASQALPDGLSCADLVHTIAVAVYTCSMDGRITFSNAAATELWGCEPNAGPDQWCGTQRIFDAEGRPLPLDAYPTRLSLTQSLDGGAVSRQELIIRRPDGALRFVLSMSRPLFDAAGLRVGAVDSMVDITDSRHADSARLLREAVLLRALDASRMALWDLDVDSGRVLLSEGWSEMLGGPREPVRTTFGALATLVPEGDRKRISAAMNPAIDGATASYSVEHRVRRPAGDLIWILSEGKVIERDAEGKAVRAIGTNRDITERKQAESAMIEGEARFRELVELSVDWYWEQDEHFRFTQMSSYNDTHAGVPTAAHIGKTRWELPHVGISDEEWLSHRQLLERQEAFKDIEFTRPGSDGALHTIAVSGTPRFDAAGRFVGYRGVARDLSAKRAAEVATRELETQLNQAQKLEAMGTLAGGIARDLNHIVTAVLDKVSLARDDIANGGTGLHALEQIHTAAMQARALSSQILDFGRLVPQVHVDHA